MACLRTSFRKLGALFCLLGLAGCEHNAQAPTETLPALIRGDDVVVERSAAVFFQGKVLSLDGDRLRVQADGELLTVALADAYRVPAIAHAFVAGQPAICKVRPMHWVAARIVAVGPRGLTVMDADGGRYEIALTHAIVPTAVTRLNIEQHLRQAAQRRSFMAAATAAGAPRAPNDWRPEPKERVVALRERSWFSARVADLADGGVTVSWDDGSPETAVERSGVVPPPPHDHVFSSGEFGLMEPQSSSERWQPVRVESVDRKAELGVLDVNGARYRIHARQVLPLSAPR